jgi:hypothetical protein
MYKQCIWMDHAGVTCGTTPHSPIIIDQIDDLQQHGLEKAVVPLVLHALVALIPRVRFRWSVGRASPTPRPPHLMTMLGKDTYCTWMSKASFRGTFSY